MALSIKTNKSKKFFIRINPKNSGVGYTLGFPGVTITITTKGFTKKTKSIPAKETTQFQEIKSAEIHHFQPDECNYVLSKISRLIKLNTFSTCLCITLVLAFIPLIIKTLPFIITILFVITSTVGLLLKIYVHSIGRLYIDYKRNDDYNEAYRQKILALEELVNTQCIWQVIGTIQYVETETVPGDAEVLKYTWNYVNNDGSPDKRYKNNIKLPICNYGAIYLNSESGLNINLHISNVEVAKKIYTLFTS